MTSRISPGPVRAGWWATVVLFLVHGLVVATWVSRIPAVQSALGLANGVLGLTLLSSAVGAVSSIPFAGFLVSRYGSKKVSAASSVLFCLSLVPLGLAFNAITLSLALLFSGAVAAAMDVSMNAQGVEVEKELGAPTMSRFHGMFSLGGMIGAGLGGLLAAHGIKVPLQFSSSAGLNLIAVLIASPFLLDTHRATEKADHRLPLNKIPRVLFALSAIGFCILLSEGAMGDWTAVYLKQVLHAGAGTAATGYAVFSASMAIFRFLGDIITARLGPFLTVRTGSLVAAAGLLWALSMRSPDWALPGFAVAGAGFSVIIPLVFGSGGRVESISPGAGIATVTGIGYLGFIIGPPAIGFASQLFTLRIGLGIVVACCFISALLAASMRSLAPGGGQEHAADVNL
ncbi:MAG: MFS transporter [Acidobacteriota bacterium]|nr:MFS transporter [Acidobacteriota bacterium]MDQ2843130.1 MFS transporter [Acidobacteriota bacterium]